MSFFVQRRMLVVFDCEDEGHEAMERLDMDREEAVLPDDSGQQLRLLHQSNILRSP
jgi:hypothetical protein